MKEKIAEFNQSNIGKIIIKTTIGIILSLALFFLIYGLSTNKNASDVSNSGFACFGLLVAIAFFDFGNQTGLLDSYKYGFTFIFGAFGRINRAKYGDTYQDYKAYMDNKREEKRDTFYKYSYFIYLGLSLVYLVVAIVYFCLSKQYVNNYSISLN